MAASRLATVPDPPLLPGRSARQPWSDQRLHRLVRLSPWDAPPALHRVLHVTRGVIRAAPAAPRERRAWRRTPAASLVLDLAAPVDSRLGTRGALHVHPWGRAIPVEVTLEPWSVHQSDLCLQPRRRRYGPHLPRGYYDAAHRVMDELWHLIERADPA